MPKTHRKSNTQFSHDRGYITVPCAADQVPAERIVKDGETPTCKTCAK